MEVLNGEDINVSGPNGKTLIQTVVSLTELPEPLVHHEMNEILMQSGHESEVLTLAELRAAMLSYLEAIHEEMGFEEEQAQEHELSLVSDHDAESTKTPAISE